MSDIRTATRALCASTALAAILCCLLTLFNAIALIEAGVYPLVHIVSDERNATNIHLRIYKGLLQEKQWMSKVVQKIQKFELRSRAHEFETHEQCLSRGMGVAQRMFLGRNFTAYEDIRTGTMDWVQDNCYRLVFAPLVPPPRPELMAHPNPLALICNGLWALFSETWLGKFLGTKAVQPLAYLTPGFTVGTCAQMPCRAYLIYKPPADASLPVPNPEVTVKRLQHQFDQLNAIGYYGTKVLSVSRLINYHIYLLEVILLVGLFLLRHPASPRRPHLPIDGFLRLLVARNRNLWSHVAYIESMLIYSGFINVIHTVVGSLVPMYGEQVLDMESYKNFSIGLAAIGGAELLVWFGTVQLPGMYVLCRAVQALAGCTRERARKQIKPDEVDARDNAKLGEKEKVQL